MTTFIVNTLPDLQTALADLEDAVKVEVSVSKAIAAVEHAVGLRLLDRGAHGVQPTIYGRALLRCGVAVFGELRQGVSALEFLADAGTGELRIGCSESLAAGFISVVVDRLSRRYPRAVFHVVPADPTALIDRELRERNIEAAITWIPQPNSHDDLDVEVLFEDRLILMANSSSKWARRRKIAWEHIGQRLPHQPDSEAKAALRPLSR
jgi:DNA-binding transcriptional LysR family regulator